MHVLHKGINRQCRCNIKACDSIQDAGEFLSRACRLLCLVCVAAHLKYIQQVGPLRLCLPCLLVLTAQE